MHDYEVLSRINDLASSLKCSYLDLNTDVTKKILATIQTSIQRKDEEMAWADSCCLQFIAKQKNGKEETFTFQTENPTVKKEWTTELRLAQLALDANNSPAWEVPEHEHRPSTKMPLFVEAQPIVKSHIQTEVRFESLKFFLRSVYLVTDFHNIFIRYDVAVITPPQNRQQDTVGLVNRTIFGWPQPTTVAVTFPYFYKINNVPAI